MQQSVVHLLTPLCGVETPGRRRAFTPAAGNSVARTMRDELSFKGTQGESPGGGRATRGVAPEAITPLPARCYTTVLCCIGTRRATNSKAKRSLASFPQPLGPLRRVKRRRIIVRGVKRRPYETCRRGTAGITPPDGEGRATAEPPRPSPSVRLPAPRWYTRRQSRRKQSPTPRAHRP